jgi:hypothetical protein
MTREYLHDRPTFLVLKLQLLISNDDTGKTCRAYVENMKWYEILHSAWGFA